MKMEVASLEPRIREILTAPGTDLTTISAKRVRRQLWEDDDSSVTEEYIRSNKDQVDRLIESVYESVNYATGETEVTSSPKAMKRKRERSDDGTNTVNDVPDADRSSTAPPPSKSKSKSAKPRKDGISDEEYARQLSSELNKRESRSSRAIGVKSSGSKSKNGASRTSKKSKKSATEVDEDGNEIKADGGGAKGGFAKELILRLVYLLSYIRALFDRDALLENLH